MPLLQVFWVSVRVQQQRFPLLPARLWWRMSSSLAFRAASWLVGAEGDFWALGLLRTHHVRAGRWRPSAGKLVRAALNATLAYVSSCPLRCCLCSSSRDLGLCNSVINCRMVTRKIT